MSARQRRVRLVAAVVMGAAGCAPRELGPAVAWYADRHAVRDASARRVNGCWYLRFNALMVSDLDEAIEAGRREEESQMRERAELVVRAAAGLAESTAEQEIDRLPPEARSELARLAGTETDTAEDVKAVFVQRLRRAEEALLAEVASLPADRLRARLTSIRRSIEPAPDDRGRAMRQVALAWGAAPAWLGVAAAERKLEERREKTVDAAFAQAVAWLPRTNGRSDLPARLAPLVLIAEPPRRSYPAQYDRLGEVYLTGRPGDVSVHVNTSRPVVYAYADETKIHGRRHVQLVFAWWYPERPAMEKDDPAAGHIDGDTLRITLDAQGRPAIFEVMQSCGCGHLVYVSDSLEQAARRQFGRPSGDRKWSVQGQSGGRRDLIVMGAIEVPACDPHAITFVEAGYHSVVRVDCVSGLDVSGLNAIRSELYELVDYDRLERLPLGDGVASMFGPDGLVHGAGRREGWLLAPTGILSAGQPRKRGTQKIRWDEYSFDDPHLLEKALRLPDTF